MYQRGYRTKKKTAIILSSLLKLYVCEAREKIKASRRNSWGIVRSGESQKVNLKDRGSS